MNEDEHWDIKIVYERDIYDDVVEWIIVNGKIPFKFVWGLIIGEWMRVPFQKWW